MNISVVEPIMFILKEYNKLKNKQNKNRSAEKQLNTIFTCTLAIYLFKMCQVIIMCLRQTLTLLT